MGAFPAVAAEMGESDCQEVGYATGRGKGWKKSFEHEDHLPDSRGVKEWKGWKKMIKGWSSEEREQMALFAWLDWVAKGVPEAKWVFHIPNGGDRHPAVGRKLRRMGVKAGVPDIFVPVPRGGYHGLWIEMKGETGRVKKVQKPWLEFLREQGYRVEVCRGADEAMSAIVEYLGEGEEEWEEK